MAVRPLCPSLQLKAQRELNEVPSRVSSDILALREWLKQQPHLKSVNPTDQWLVGFLRGNKFSLQRAKEKLDIYYTLRTIVPEIFHNRDPFDPLIQNILKSGCCLPLKDSHTDDASRIIISRFKGGHDVLNMAKVIYMIVEILILEDDNFIISGCDDLYDLQDTGLSFIIQCTPTVIKKSYTCIENALPVRMKSWHVIHAPPGYETVHALIKRYISDKHNKRIFIHHNRSEEMNDIFPRNLLPKEYGGENGTVQDLIDYWKVKVESYRDWFIREAEQHSDEALRPGEPTTSSNLFGVEGSFRKMEID